MNNDTLSYEPPFRAPYEYKAAVGWVASGLGTLGMTVATGLPATLGLSIACGSFGMAGYRYWKGRPFEIARNRLKQVDSLWFMPRSRANQWYAWARAQHSTWLGEGFEITPTTAEKIRFVAARGLGETLNLKQRDGRESAGWVQQIEAPKPILLNDRMMDGHVLIVGSTGKGKTRLFDHFLTQAILRGEPVIALDPKGDHDLEDLMRDTYARLGVPEKFAAFRASRPETSVRLDPLANWSRTTEVASRVAALVEADGTFKAFVWRVLNNLVQGELLAGRKPNLMSLRRLVEMGSAGLVLEVLKSWCAQYAQPEEYMGYVNNAKTKTGMEVQGYIEFYERVLSKRQGKGSGHSPEIDGLIQDFNHDKEHFSKMVVSLTPILTMLTTPPLDDLLSPVVTPGDTREITTIDKIVKQGRGLYVSLSSMSDPIIGAAIGSILLADTTALAGERYDSGDIGPTVNLLADEVAEISNEQLTQLLNKGRGAKFRTLIATQTLADLVVRLGGEPEALQQIGNLNNVIILGLQDPKTAEMLAKALPRYQARSVKRSFSQSIQPTPGDAWGGGYSEGLEQQEVELVTPDLLMRLPPLHYIARFADGRIVKARFPIVGEDRR
ncbi:conjugative transfer system coupling protein TraD [Acidihalobacter prosperus]|uniref:Conjugal transfer protein n=1 Tax=Acidihalobacter prosperus TaxID=160660 RepID=A0A1A6C335_9GAMM|nr:conjugative transfer system coupling protein TraD [Acidihalobacter prosperus]OBS08973.1 hypothetical protein Thpro_022090 [Acidihalobacter prosperus]